MISNLSSWLLPGASSPPGCSRLTSVVAASAPRSNSGCRTVVRPSSLAAGMSSKPTMAISSGIGEPGAARGFHRSQRQHVAGAEDGGGAVALRCKQTLHGAGAGFLRIGTVGDEFRRQPRLAHHGAVAQRATLARGRTRPGSSRCADGRARSEIASSLRRLPHCRYRRCRSRSGPSDLCWLSSRTSGMPCARQHVNCGHAQMKEGGDDAVGAPLAAASRSRAPRLRAVRRYRRSARRSPRAPRPSASPGRGRDRTGW